MVASVTTEATLVDLAVWGAVERQTHVLEVDNGLNRFLREDLSGVLVDQVVATLDGVEGVPFPAVLFNVGQRCGHATLCCTGVRASREEL